MNIQCGRDSVGALDRLLSYRRTSQHRKCSMYAPYMCLLKCTVVQVIAEQFPEVGPPPIPHGVTALGRKDLIRQVLADEGLQDIEIGQVCIRTHFLVS